MSKNRLLTKLALGSTATPSSIACTQTCQASYTINSYANDRKKGVNHTLIKFDTDAIKLEIMARGPVVAEFDLYTDLFQVATVTNLQQNKK